MSNKKNSIDQLLANIKPVKAPAFLLTRISARLEEHEIQSIEKKWLVASFLGIILLILINYWGLSRYVYSVSDLTEFAQNMKILDIETLY